MRRPCSLSVCGSEDSGPRQSFRGYIVVESDVAAGFGPFVLLLGQDRSNEKACCRLVGEDAHHVGAPAYLLVQPLERIVGPQLPPMSHGEASDSQDVGAGILQNGRHWSFDLETTLRQAQDAVYAVRNTAQQRDAQSLRDIFDRYLQDQATAADLLTVAGAPLMTGFADLDELLGGVQRSDLVILAARPSVGKSTLALNMAMHNAKSGRTCAIFSLEMTADQLAMRALASETGIDSHRIRLGLYSSAKEERIINAIGELSELPLYIDDTPYQGMVEIRGKTRRLDLDRGVDLIMVDYLQLVQGRHRGGPANRVQEITEISRALKVLAGEMDASVIACSQMSRMVENRPSHRPQLSDLRDSGSIEQDADVVAFIHREDLYTTEEEWAQTHPGQEYPRNIAEIIVAKNRKGPTGSIRLEFRDHLVRFDPVSLAMAG